MALKCLRLKVTVLILSCINTTINSNWKKMPSAVNNTSAFFCPIRCAARMPTVTTKSVGNAATTPIHPAIP